MKTSSPNPQLKWLLRQTAAQFLVKPADLRRGDRHAWRAAARDAFCLVAYRHQLGTHQDIADTLGRDRSTISHAIDRAATRLSLHNDLTSLATQVLGEITARAKIYGSRSISRAPENCAEMASGAQIRPSAVVGRGGTDLSSAAPGRGSAAVSFGHPKFQPHPMTEK